MDVIGRTGLNGTKDIVYDKIRSDAEKTILGLVNESGGRKFKHVAIEYDPSKCSTLGIRGEINSTGESVMQDILLINNELLKDMYGVYSVYPEVVPAALRLSIEHELSHRTGIYSAVDKIIKNYAGRALRKKGHPPEGKMKMFVFVEGFLNTECINEREYKANLQAMTSRLKEPGMTFEKLEDEVAAKMWLINGKMYKAARFKNIGDLERICSNYIETYFPRLGDEFKEQITEKIFEIDKEYRKRCKETADGSSGRSI